MSVDVGALQTHRTKVDCNHHHALPATATQRTLQLRSLRPRAVAYRPPSCTPVPRSGRRRTTGAQLECSRLARLRPLPASTMLLCAHALRPCCRTTPCLRNHCLTLHIASPNSLCGLVASGCVRQSMPPAPPAGHPEAPAPQAAVRFVRALQSSTETALPLAAVRHAAACLREQGYDAPALDALLQHGRSTKTASLGTSCGAGSTVLPSPVTSASLSCVFLTVDASSRALLLSQAGPHAGRPQRSPCRHEHRRGCFRRPPHRSCCEQAVLVAGRAAGCRCHHHHHRQPLVSPVTRAGDARRRPTQTPPNPPRAGAHPPLPLRGCGC